MKTKNPALKIEKFLNITAHDNQVMTISGTIQKTVILLLCALATASLSWYLFSTGSASWFTTLAATSFAGALVTGFYTVFRPNHAHITAPIYALCEGFLLGSISLIAEREVPGVTMCAVYLTIGTLIAMLLAYKLEFIKVNDTFRGVILSATLGLALAYTLDLILSFFGGSIPFIYSAGIGGIIFSLFAVTIAALRLVCDFDFIYQASEQEVPKRAEWYAGFSLLLSIIWLYMEIIRLLLKYSRRK